jgi:hypothetical protein
MGRVQDIKARLASGALKDFRAEVSEGQPWQLEYHGLDDTLHRLPARDLFEALAAM